MTTLMPEGASEWVRLDDASFVAAGPERMWLGRGACPEPPERGATTPAVTRNLLDAAVRAAFAYARPGAVPPLSATRWAYRLAGLYHLTHSTPALLRRAAERFAAQGRGALADWASQRAREESHHDLLALRDLRELGYDAARVIDAVRPGAALRLVDYFAASVDADDPIGCVGYAYAVERLAMTVGEPEIRAVEALLPAGVRATRCLRVHSAAGSDADHVEDTVAVLAGRSAAERRRVALAAHATARLCFEPDPAGVPSDADLAARLVACAAA